MIRLMTSLALFAATAGAKIFAGGGGENLLLIVNPSDEPSLRIADAYVRARNIPTNNIVYIDPTNGKGVTLWMSDSTFTSLYTATLPGIIAARGLTNQIDYIGTLGQPHFITGSSPSYIVGFNAALNHLTQLQKGFSPIYVLYRQSEIVQNVPPSGNTIPWNYVRGSNPAIYHSQLWIAPGAGPETASQWYMSGEIGYSGLRGVPTDRMIQALERTAKGDGTNPSGTIYFEDSQEVRSAARSSYWPGVQAYLTSAGIPWVQELGITPKNRSSVRGAVVGSATPTLATQFVNGSAYTPGSWADDLTSFAGSYSDGNQTKVSNFLLAGAGATAGAVTEPLAAQARFTYSSIFAFSEDGSTLGEAFYKSIRQPDLLIFQGDLLSQAYADIPAVSLTAGPAEGATVSGQISVSGSASLNNPRLATGIAKLSFFVDGVQRGEAVSGSTASFNLDTTILTDGVHELRIIAFNNSQAASQGRVIRSIVVNNQNQSVAVTGTQSYRATPAEALSIPVAANQGTGPAINSIQLQQLGRVVGSINAANGNVSLDASKLAYGKNTITPVAVLASGSVQGNPITVVREMQKCPGTTPTPVDQRNPGVDFTFFGGVVGSSSNLDNINFNATPSFSTHSMTSGINPGSTYSPGSRNMPDAFYVNGYYAYGLAVQIKCKFTVTIPGEYLFSPSFAAYTSAGIYVDDVLLARNDKWNSSTWTQVDAPRSIYLLPGEHSLVVKLGQSRSGRNDYETTFSLVMRGPDGNTIGVNGPFFYTTK